MKLFHKIFICFVVLFGIAFQLAGFLLINFSYEKVMEQEKRFAAQEFQHNKYIMLSFLYSDSGMTADGIDFNSYADKFSVSIAIYGIDKSCLYSDLSVPFEPVSLTGIEDNRVAYQIKYTEDGSYILVSGIVRQNEIEVYLVTEWNISETVNSQNDMIFYFQKIYLWMIVIGIPVILLLSGWLVRSIGKVGRAAKRIAEGRYAERIETSLKDEIGELASDFNHMAENIEEKIAELSDQAQQKEDFAANFAHELKTPLTSVIGYADMLYQKDLPREQVKSAAEYILNEGMRLEELSLKLMDIFVMDKQVFPMEDISVREICENLKQMIGSICANCGVKPHIQMPDGRIQVDYDLFKSAIFNMVDNSIKADCKDIWITGEAKEGIYRICLEDNGKGIPPEELGRITEAFYMVDKSRARKLHGAGLGMALVSKIMDIHKAGMKIESDGKTGTKIILSFMQKGENER